MSDQEQPPIARPKGTRLNTTAWRLATTGVVFLFLLLWEALPTFGLVSAIILPKFSDVAVSFVSLVTGPVFFKHFWITVLEILWGFGIAVTLGLALGLALGLSRTVKRLTYPLVIAFQSIPKIVLAPLLITWAGYGMESKIALAVIIAFFPVLINTIVGLDSVPVEWKRLMYSLRASRKQMFWKLELPYAAPVIFAGIKTALTFAVTGAVVAEFVGANAGMGFLIHAYAFQLMIPKTFAVILVLSLIGSLLYGAIALLDQKLIFWRNAAT
jgi:NitT/TauT family transport system permease protein